MSGDALIATDRYTCYAVNAMEQFRRKFYFVRDYEPLFYPAGTEALLTEATYSFDFDCLCAGEWLHNIMSEVRTVVDALAPCFRQSRLLPSSG